MMIGESQSDHQVDDEIWSENLEHVSACLCMRVWRSNVGYWAEWYESFVFPK
jgi:hypothetical protein